jgi:hypothetical protein
MAALAGCLWQGSKPIGQTDLELGGKFARGLLGATRHQRVNDAQARHDVCRCTVVEHTRVHGEQQITQSSKVKIKP